MQISNYLSFIGEKKKHFMKEFFPAERCFLFQRLEKILRLLPLSKRETRMGLIPGGLVPKPKMASWGRLH